MDEKKKLSYPLRMCAPVRESATRLARAEGLSLNNFISIAVAEKIARMEHETRLLQQNKERPPAASRFM